VIFLHRVVVRGAFLVSAIMPTAIVVLGLGCY
jgi:hypothetical protein